MRKRVFSCVLVVIIVGSLCFVPSAALVSDLKDVINETTFAEYVRGDYFSKVITAFFKGQSEDDHGQFFCATPYALKNNVFVTETALDSLATRFNTDYGAASKFTLTKTFLSDTGYYGLRILGSSQNDYSLCWLADNAGRAILAEPEDETEGGQWLHLNQALSAPKKKMLSREALQNLANKLDAHVMSTSNYYMITNTRGNGVYADSAGLPFAAWVNEGQAAINQPRPDTSVKDETGEAAKDENGQIIDNSTNDNSTNIDLSGMTITLPNGDVQIADAVIYDESTKTYYIDSHDTTNINITYNYHWEYHINYTSITYIGQTEQYDKYYEVYYELPDGRDSADLTAEDLEQLDFALDVVGYARSADDTSLRALYHFDGDTHDSSYWNYCSDFVWHEGASLTYMDAGAFNGALYLDEGNHRFTFVLPSNIGDGNFTMSFRYYQSATPAPQYDSAFYFWTNKDGSAVKNVLAFDGALLHASNGATVSLSTGTWNEICLQRHDGYIYYMLNGVCWASVSDPTFYYASIGVQFGSKQQTYRYLDEFRFVNKALYEAPYECPSVPFDTNLSLVLPDSAKPVADEYWSFDKTITPYWCYDFTNSTLPSCSATNYPGDLATFGGGSQKEGYVHIAGSATGSLTFYPPGQTKGDGSEVFPRAAAAGDWYSKLPLTCQVVTKDGSMYAMTVTMPDGRRPPINASQTFDWGTMNFTGQMLNLKVNAGSALDVVYIELVPGTEANTGHKWVTQIVPVESYEKPTLAVRTDIPITGKQIGGPRPSLPEKGLVWAMVEGGVIKSIQIYNGQAWQACDGRIFTGTRWIPYGSYNIITMKDFYDVVDASGQDFSYIYSETGFWNWWQKSWNTFTNRFFSALESAGLDTGGTNPDGTSKSLWQKIKDAFNNSLGTLIAAVFDLITEVLAALLGLVMDMLSFFFGFFTDTVTGAIRSFFTSISDPALFDFFQRPPVVGPDGSESSGGYGLPDEVGTAFAFISGVIMILPAELRSIMFFAIAAMAFLGVLKLVKS